MTKPNNSILRSAVFCLAACLLLLVGACSRTHLASGKKKVTIIIDDSYQVPETTEASKGDLIKWVNESDKDVLVCMNEPDDSKRALVSKSFFISKSGFFAGTSVIAGPVRQNAAPQPYSPPPPPSAPLPNQHEYYYYFDQPTVYSDECPPPMASSGNKNQRVGPKIIIVK